MNKNPYEALRRHGHSPAKAAEIILDAARGDWFSQQWIGLISDADQDDLADLANYQSKEQPL